MLTKTLTTQQTEQIIAQLDTIADTLFASNKNFLGNQLQEIVYCLEAELAEMLEE
jgi:hypothetical protein